MAGIFKQQYTTTVKKNGKPVKIKRKTRCWYIEYRNADDVLRRVKGFKDKTATRQLADQLERKVALAAVGIVDRYEEHKKRPLTEHLEDFENALRADQLTENHVVTTRRRAEVVMSSCGFVRWNDISASSVQQFVVKMKRAAKTRREYLQSAKQFCTWMVQDRRAGENPLAHLKPVTVTQADTQQRRALTPDEIATLLHYTPGFKKRFRLTGSERALLYRLALETGLRAGELRSLRKRSFDFDENTVTVVETDTKNRKLAVLPLRIETAAMLKAYLGCKTPKAVVFGMAHRTHTAKMLYRDLDEARGKWIDEVKGTPEESERVKSKYLMDDEMGNLDFHALRHTFGSLLAASGIHPKVAQELMRHSDINLTMSRYTHVFHGQEADAVAKLPDFSRRRSQENKATGTDGQWVEPAEKSYKKTYSDLTEKAYSGCQQSASGGTERQGKQAESTKKWTGRNSCDMVALGAKKKPMTTDVTGSNRHWVGLDSNQRKLTLTGLQPVPFSHSGTDPNEKTDSTDQKP